MEARSKSSEKREAAQEKRKSGRKKDEDGRVNVKNGDAKKCCACAMTGSCKRCSCAVRKVACTGCIPSRYNKCCNRTHISSPSCDEPTTS